MNNSFLITGFGRSGTKFLSSVMNRSTKWTVEHEPRSNDDIQRIQPTKSLLEAFNRDYYGEVNSYLRYDWTEVPVNKYGFIIRDPKDIVLSCANRNDLKRTLELVDEIFTYQKDMKKLQEFDDNDIFTFIDFNKMTTDKEYLYNILKTFGIIDVDVNLVNIGVKINANKSIKYNTFEELPNKIKNKFKNYE